MCDVNAKLMDELSFSYLKNSGHVDSTTTELTEVFWIFFRMDNEDWMIEHIMSSPGGVCDGSPSRNQIWRIINLQVGEN